MENKVVIVTGATNGIGEITAIELARKGATVVVVSRSKDKCRATVEKIKQETGNEDISYITGDLSLMSDVQRVANEFKAQFKRLDVLVNNAGAYFQSRQETSEGNEMTLALNHLNYFLLTHHLLDLLKATGEEQGEACIVNVSSGAHNIGKLNIDDLQRTQNYSAFRVYGESKLMNVMFTYELARRLKGTNVTVNALHPGFVRTGFGKNNNSLLNIVFGAIQVFAISPEKGAETSIHLASSSEVKGITGKYWDKSKATSSSKASHDEAMQKQLWAISEKLTGIASAQPA